MNVQFCLFLYLITLQDESITSQLEHGIRYLDIRVGFYKGTRWPISVFNRLRNKESRPDEFWVNHGPAKMQPLEGVLKEINSFAERTNEIIIVDIQEFPVGKLHEIKYKNLYFLNNLCFD